MQVEWYGQSAFRLTDDETTVFIDPFGATGARLVMTMLNEMIRRKAGTGLATMCAAGGLGLTLILERE